MKGLVWFQKIFISPPREIIGNSEGEGGGVMGKYFPKGDGPRTKHWKQSTIDMKHKNTPGHWDDVNIVSFNVSVFLWVS